VSTRNGALLWRRRRLTLAPGNTNVDTGLIQPNLSFPADEPPLGVATTAPGPADGTLPASRVQVIPQAPYPSWDNVSHGEPYLNTTTNTVHVEFTNAGKSPTTINVLFWDPHTSVSPGEADTYNAEEIG